MPPIDIARAAKTSIDKISSCRDRESSADPRYEGWREGRSHATYYWPGFERITAGSRR